VISVMGSVFHDQANLYSGAGFDTIAVDFCRFDDSGARVIDSGADADFVLVARSIMAEGDLIIRTGGGNDRVVLGRYFCGVDGGLLTGGNTFASVQLDTGSEDDVADIRGNMIDEFFAVFGGGNDDVTVAFNSVNDQALLDGGGGFDELFAAGNLLNDADIVGFESQALFTGPSEDECLADGTDGDGGETQPEA
jgi:hypothetical protein